MPKTPSAPSAPKSWDELCNEAKDAYSDGQKLYDKGDGYYDKADGYYEKGKEAYERGEKLYERGSDVYDKGSDIYEDKDQWLDKAGDLYENREEALARGKEAWEDVKDGDFEGALSEAEDALGVGFGEMVGADSDGFCDCPHAAEEMADQESADATEQPVAVAETDEQATAVLCVCRNLTNTIDTRPVGYAWFSA